jgi:non-heme chloroperoxidase
VRLRYLALVAGAVIGALLVALAAALAFGGPTRPPPMRSISDPFKDVDFSSLPPLGRYAARDGALLAYRFYAPAASQAGRGSVVLVHGSSADSQSMHPLAQSLARAGFAVYALDMRGHGGSGPHGDIAYVGQLDDDLADFMQAEHPAHPRTLVGFSAGGGFAIRVAGGARQTLFDNYLFMAPYTNRRAPNYRPAAGGWLSVGVSRLVAIRLLNRVGITAFNHLTTVDFAVTDEPKAQLTPSYSYALATNFQPRADYRQNIRDIHEPAAVLDGQDDEVFIAGKFAQVFAEAGRPDIPVTLVPGAGHITLTLAPAARAVAVSAVERLEAASPSARGMPRVEQKPLLVQIIERTPSWVFVLFFVLVGLGYVQSRNRTVRRGSVAIIPLAMIALSLYGVLSAFGVAPAGLVFWLLGVGIAVWLGLNLPSPRGLSFSSESRSFFVPGSWIPLGLMMAIFFTKYAVNVIQARHLPIATGLIFIGAASLCYGILSGAFLVRALVIRRAAGRTTVSNA